MTIQTVDAKTLKTWLDAGEAVLVDVREPAEYAAEHIAGSVLLPLSQFSADALPVFEHKKLVVHCRKGGRGGTACERILAVKPDEVIYNLEGGLTAWSEAGLPLASLGGKCLPLDRQVQLTAGAMIFLISLLGFFLTPIFCLLAAAAGVGLMIAGLTGFCGLAVVMAKMPWNQKAGATGNSCCINRVD
jgi:rhodanese-related sulfurtransferase